MDNVTRRSFLAKGSVGAVGLAATTAGLTGVAAAASDDRPLTKDELAAAAGPLLIQIVDAERGRVALLVGDQEIQYTDRRLVARVLRAAH